MGYLFGQDFNYTLYPLGDNQSINILNSQTPAIYVFPDSVNVTRAIAAAGTGAIQNITAWTDNSDGSKTFAIDGIDDPDPTSTIDRREYKLGINCKISTAEQTQTIIRSLLLERLSAHDKVVTITYTDITNEFPQATDYASTAQITLWITEAKEEVQAYLSDRGFEWAQIFRPDRLDTVVKKKTLMKLMASQRQDANDNFDRNFELYEKDYNTIIKAVQFEYDSTRQGTPDVAKVKAGGFSILAR